MAIREEQEPGSAGATGEKTTRWRPLAAQAEAGNVRVVCGAWNAAWLDELELVPFGAHDDQTDATAGAFAEVAFGPQPVRILKLTGY